MSVELTAPNRDSLQRDAEGWASRAAAATITDAESCRNASFLLRSIKGIRSDIQKWFAPHIERAMDAKRQAEATRKGLVDECERMEAPLVQAETTIKRNLLAWEQEQERIRRAEEARLQAEAQAHAEAVTLAAAAALEQEAALTGNEAMRVEAEDLLAQPIEAPAVMVKSMTPKVEGVTYRDNWTIHPEVDVKALAGAVVAGTAPLTFLAPNMTAIRAWARATKGTQSMPGVRVVNDRQVAARG